MYIFDSDSFAITVDGNDLGRIMFLMILGIFFAAAYTIFIKKLRGEFVLALIDSEAFDETSAKTLSELKIKPSKMRNFLINKNFFFVPDYHIVASENSEPKYFVDENNLKKLESKYANSGITFVQLLVTIIAFFAVALVLAAVVPDILNTFNF